MPLGIQPTRLKTTSFQGPFEHGTQQTVIDVAVTDWGQEYKSIWVIKT